LEGGAVKRQASQLVAYGKQENWSELQIAMAIHSVLDLHLLKAHRLARQWRLGQMVAEVVRVAEEAGLARPALTMQRVSHWENGERPTPDYLDLLCRLYKTRPDRLGFGVDFTPPEDEGQTAAVVPESMAAQLADLARLDHAELGSRYRDVLLSNDTVRGVLPEPVVAMIGEIGRQSTNLLERAAVSVSRVERLEEETQAQAVQYALTRPARIAGDMVAIYCDLAPMLAQRLPVEVTTRCLMLAAQLGALIGLALTECGQFSKARTWFSLSRLAAEEHSGRDVRSWTIALAASEAAAIGDRHRAARLLEQAGVLAQPDTAGAAIVGVALAERLARSGNSRMATDMLRRAETHFAALDAEQVGLSWLGYPAVLYHTQRGGVLAELGMTAPAEEALSAARAVLPDGAYLLDAQIKLHQLACDLKRNRATLPYDKAF
jgi:transcriptional regulator with XRE-family HTH domain